MHPLIKKILRYLIAICVAIGLIYYVSSKIDEKRKEESDRIEKIQTGNCDFDEIDLKSLAVTYNGRSFKTILNLDTLKMFFSEYLSGLNTRDSTNDNSLIEKSFRIENNTFWYYQKENKAYLKMIDMNFNSPFTVQINGKTIFTPQFQLKDFEDKYPKSYSCRWNQSTTWRSETYAIRFNSNRIGSDLNGLILFFTNAENLCGMEFLYSFEEQ